MQCPQWGGEDNLAYLSRNLEAYHINGGRHTGIKMQSEIAEDTQNEQSSFWCMEQNYLADTDFLHHNWYYTHHQELQEYL